MLISEVHVGDYAIKPVYGRISDLWIGNSGIWYAEIEGKRVALDRIQHIILREK